MVKKITLSSLRFNAILFLLFTSLNLTAQNVDVVLSVNWPNWSSENKVELYNPSGTLLQTVDNGYDGNGNAPYTETTTAVSYPVDDNIPAGTGYYVTVYDFYGDDWNSSGSLTITADGVTVYTFDGNFTNNVGTGNPVEISQTFYFAINAPDDASFSYPQASYCPATDSNPTPTITGETGGTFTAPSGLTINASTGLIDLSTSTDGSYQVTYTTTAPNQNSSQETITIGGSSTFEYTTSSATQTDADLAPTVTGSGGTFSSTSGLSINATTGIIDVSASTPGTYTVSFTTTSNCPAGPVVITDDVTITASSFPGVAVYNNTANDFPNNASNEYIQYIPGNMPVIISAPHGGKKTGNELPTRNCGTGEEDDNTDILIKEIQKLCYEQYGLYPYIIVNDLRRNKLDPNRVKSVATCNGNAQTEEYFDAFHYFIDQASAEVTTNYGKGLYIDLHGQSHSIPRIEAGYNLQSSVYNASDINSAANLAKVTIKNLIENNLQNLGFDDMVRGTDSFGGLMQVTGGAEYAAAGHAGCGRTEGYRTVPSHIDNGSSNCDDTNPSGSSYFAGDFYNNIRHGSGDSSISNNVSGGGSINGGGGTIDGIMTEVNRRVRDVGNVYSGAPYNRPNDGRTATIPGFSRDYATVIKDFIDLHYNDFSDFAYANSTYDLSDASNPTPTITGISGGTFTASGSGLIINSSTGEINLAASTAGAYTITYLASNIESYYKKTTSITLTEMPDNASFSYPSSSVCKDEPNPTPIISGENGGNFSVVPGGLDFVSVTSGEIDLITSVSGTYTVTYTTTSPGQNSSTFEITINDLDNASFSYDSTSYPLSDPDPTPTLVGLAGGTYTSEPAGLDLDPSSGTITLINSNTGNYIVTYTVIGSCNTVVTTQNVSVTGSVLDVTDEEFTVFSIYPNPTSDLLTIESNFNVTKIEVNNLLGQKIKEFTLNENKQIDLTKLKTGTYLITFFNENKKLGTRTVIKK